MISLHIEIKDLQHIIRKSYLSIENASYVPQLGEHIHLTFEQEDEFKNGILDSPDLKKKLMKYVRWHGRNPLKKSDWKDLTPAQIRQKVRDPEVRWAVFLPYGILLTKKYLYIDGTSTRIYYEGKFSDEFWETIPNTVNDETLL